MAKYMYTGSTKTIGRFGSVASGDILDLTASEATDIANSSSWELYTNPDEFGASAYFDGTVGVLTVTDDSNLDFGTTDFSISIEVALEDWTPATEEILVAKHASNVGYKLAIGTDGTIKLRIGNGSNFTTLVYSSTVSVGALANTRHRLDVSVDRDGNANFYVDGEAIGDAVDASGASAQTVSTAGNFTLMSDGSSFSQGFVFEVLVWNRALSSLDVFKANRGVLEADRWGSTTELASGNLTVGQRYRITAQDGEDFTADGAAANTVGTEFIATGTNVTLDANDKAYAIGAVLHLIPENIQPAGTQWLDATDNKLDGLQSVTGLTPTRPPARAKLRFTISASGFLAGSDRAVLPANYTNLGITAIASAATGATITVGQDATTDNDRVTTVVTNGTGTNGGYTVLTVLQVLTEREVYVAMDSDPSSTEFIITCDVV